MTMPDVPKVETVLINRPNDRPLGAGEASQGRRPPRSPTRSRQRPAAHPRSAVRPGAGQGRARLIGDRQARPAIREHASRVFTDDCRNVRILTQGSDVRAAHTRRPPNRTSSQGGDTHEATRMRLRFRSAVLLARKRGRRTDDGARGDARAVAGAERVGEPPEAKNMRLVGYNDLQARSAYQPVIHQQGDRYIAYVGHHGGTARVPKPVNPLTRQAEFNGTSIIDVTDPKQPEISRAYPGRRGAGRAGRRADGADLRRQDAAEGRSQRGLHAARVRQQGHEIWNVTDPAKPKQVTTISTNLMNTHKNWWECDTGIAYLVSGLKDWRTRRMTEIYDLSDPSKPVKIRDFGLVGQQPGATGTVPTDLHGVISTGVKDNRVIFAYGTNRGGVLQIVDRQKLLTGPERADAGQPARHPVIGQLEMPLNGAHTAIPLGKMKIAEFAKDKAGGTRDIIMIVNELLANECQDARRGRWCSSSTPRSRRSRRWCRTSTCRRRAATSARAAAASARIPRTRAPRRSSSEDRVLHLVQCRRARGRYPRSVFAEGDRLLHPVDHRGDRRSAASRSTARTAARSRSRATTWRPTTAATSTSSTAPTPACTFWS